MSNTKKAALAAMAGTVMAFGGCFNPQQLIQQAITASIIEFVLDNDSVFDLFEDGATGTTTAP